MTSPMHADAMLTALAVAAAKSAAVLAVAAAASLAIRRRAAVRHLVWMMAVTVALLLPAAAAVVPAWPVAVLPRRSMPAVLGDPAAPLRSHPVRADPAGLWPVHGHPADDASSGPAAAAAAPPRAAPGRPATATPTPPTNGSAVVLAVWAVGGGLVFVRWAAAAVAVRRMVATAPVASGSLAQAARAVAGEIGLRRPVPVRTGGPMPMVAGPFRPVLLLPTDAADWTDSRLRAVLLHELSHVRRHDCTTQLLAHLCCCVHWFDPLAWVAAARLRAERERACDDAALRHGADPAAYADVLLAVAAAVRGGAGPAAVGMARRSGLEERVRRILRPSVDRRSAGLRLRVAATAVAILALWLTATVRLVPRGAAAVAATPSPTTAPRPPVVDGRPQLRFLAWQRGDRADHVTPPPGWAADGRPATADESATMRRTQSFWLNVNPPHPPLAVLYLWLTDPAFDRDSTFSARLVDAHGKSLEVAHSDEPIGFTDSHDEFGTGYATLGLVVSAAGRLPAAGTVQLSYTAGPWRDLAPIPAGTEFPRALEQSSDAAEFSASGRTADGRAFVTIARATRRPVQYGFAVRTRDGRILPCRADHFSGGGDLRVERFVADVSPVDVAEYVPRTRKVRTAKYAGVPLSFPPAASPTTAPATRAAGGPLRNRPAGGPTLTATPALTAHLRDGLTIGLVGLADDPLAGSPPTDVAWWRPDGTPAGGRPWPDSASLPSDATPRRSLEVAVQVKTPVKTPGGARPDLWFDVSRPDTVSWINQGELPVPPGMRVCWLRHPAGGGDALGRLRVLVATAPWRTAVTLSAAAGGSATADVPGVGRATLAGVREVGGHAEVDATWPTDRPLAFTWRIVEVGWDGADGTTWDQTMRQLAPGRPFVDRSNGPLAKVAAFRLDWRPVAGWAEFGDVSLRAGTRTAVRMTSG